MDENNNNSNTPNPQNDFDPVSYTHLTQCLKGRAIVEDILAAASQHQVPVFLVEPTERYSSGIRITFDELDAFRELVTHLIEHHHVTKFACIAGFRGNPASETREMIFRDVLKEHGIAFDEKWFGYGDFYAFPTKALMERFLACLLYTSRCV